MLPDRCHVLMNCVFVSQKPRCLFPTCCLPRKEARRAEGTFTLSWSYFLFLCKPCQLSVCVCVCACMCLYIHILTHTDRRLCVCVCVYINQYICPAFPPCMDLRPFPLISCSTHWGITAQMEKLVNLFCSLFFADSVLIPYGAAVRIILLDRLLYII